MLRLAVEIPILRMGRGGWKMNTAMVRETSTGYDAKEMGTLEAA
jgi:hypothetical protein